MCVCVCVLSFLIAEKWRGKIMATVLTDLRSLNRSIVHALYIISRKKTEATVKKKKKKKNPMRVLIFVFVIPNEDS